MNTLFNHVSSWFKRAKKQQKQPIIASVWYGRLGDYKCSMYSPVINRDIGCEGTWNSVMDFIKSNADSWEWVDHRQDHEVFHLPEEEFMELYRYHLRQFQAADHEQRKAMLLRCRTLKAMGHRA